MSLHILCIGGAYLVPALKRLGHAVFAAQASPPADLPTPHPLTVRQLLRRLESLDFRPDALFYGDDGNLPLLLDPENAPWPSVCYSIDTYCNPWHVPYAHGFDVSLVAQKDYVPVFASAGIKAGWLPLFCPQQPLPETEFFSRDIPVSFVGTLRHKNNPDREPFLKAFRARHPLIFLSGEYTEIFRRSRIVLNQTAAAEVNFRCFEAIGCGAALLMETSSNGLDELFTPGEELLPTYPRNNARAAADIAAASLARPEQLAEIALAGHRAVSRRHTATVRAASLAHILAGLCADQAHRPRLERELERRAALVRAAYGMLSSELTGPQWREYREFFEKLCLNTL